MLMLDTNICIYIIKQKPPVVLEHFREYQIGDIGISSITLAELRFGVAKSQYQEKNARALDEFIIPLEILPFDEMATLAYGEIRASLEKAGTPIGSMDLLIAAHAVSLKISLVTNNTREFRRVPGLVVIDWTIGVEQEKQ
ncbi:MAG: type II toxin-antitoxin system VapC family toxin [Desulfuromonadales bacterium]|nr:type II toxin-antitoxin system VapC family toxin [Desulfuromonadales bacterium]